MNIVKIERAPRRRFTIAGEGEVCERVSGFGGMAPLSIGQARRVQCQSSKTWALYGVSLTLRSPVRKIHSSPARSELNRTGSAVLSCPVDLDELSEARQPIM